MSGFKKDGRGYWIEKDPSAILDYSLDWSAWLQPEETIVVSSWNVPVGMTAQSEVNDTTVSTVWLAGGTTDKEYVVTNRIVTSGGRQDERSFRIVVRNR